MSEADLPDRWPERIRTLRADAEHALTALAPLQAASRRAAELRSLLRDLERHMDRAERAAVITLVGSTGAGKSALLNALVGRSIAREGLDRPTTRQPVIYAPLDADLSDLLAVSGEGGVVPRPEVVRYDPASGPWSRHVLVDAPDLNSVAVEHRATVDALAQHSDVLVVVLHRQSVIEDSPIRFLDELARRRGLVFVLNRRDELAEESCRQLLEQIRELARERWRVPEAPVLAVSAKGAQSEPASPGWSDLCQVLMRLARDSDLARIRRRNVLGTLERLGERGCELRAEVSTELEALAGEVAEGCVSLAEHVTAEVAQRLALRRNELVRRLWAETAQRWDGPGGWALRVGGISGFGAGAGALIARRHPLLAAGAAIGSVAAEEVRRSSERQRLVDPTGLAPDDFELQGWYGEALAAARIRAARLTGDAEAFAVPSLPAVRETVVDAVGDAWGTLVLRDLPDAAERSLLRHFRLALDLPVYALGGWVAYQVARGFLAEQYVGVDFLVNAALLGLGYLFAERFLVRRLLALRARSLLRDVSGRVRAVLQARMESLGEAADREIGRKRAALDRLAELAQRLP